MTISGNTMIPGATALVYMNLANMQKAMAEMQRDNLALFTGTTDSDGNKTSGFFEVQKMCNDTALKESNTAAEQTRLQGWTQLGENMASAATQFGGLIAGHVSTKKDTAEVADLQTKLDSGVKATVVPVNGSPDANNATATLVGSNTTNTTTTTTTTTTTNAGSDVNKPAKITEQTEERTKLQQQIDNKNAIITGQRTYCNTIAGVLNSAATAGFKAAEGQYQAENIKANGRKDYMQNTSGMIQQAAGIATNATQAQLSAEQSLAQAMQTIISITGSARG
jgi:hypothetical protein